MRALYLSLTFLLIAGVAFAAQLKDTIVDNDLELTASGVIRLEGTTDNAFEQTITTTDPTADRTMTLPNADSNPVQPLACSGSDKVTGISSAGVISCGTDQGGSSGIGNDLNGVQFLVVSTTGTLSDERALTGGASLTCTDNGAGSTYECAVDDDFVRIVGDTMTGALIMSGVASDFQTVSNQDLTLAPDGTGDVVISGSLDIGVDICAGLQNGGALTTDANGIIVCENDDGGGGAFSGGSGVLYFIPESFTVYGSIAISGTLDADQPASISTQGGTLDYHVLAFNSGDGGNDSGASREFNIPSDYVDTPQLQIYYMMETANSGTVEWEGELLCIDDGEELLNVKASITTPDVVSVTVPGTVGLMDVATINLTDPGCSPGDLAFVIISTDADDGTNDSATGLRYMKQAVFLYQDE